MVELGGFHLWWRRNDMIGNMTWAICDRWLGALVLDRKGIMMMMSVTVVVSVLCG
jgi:hypothetical protein